MPNATVVTVKDAAGVSQNVSTTDALLAVMPSTSNTALGLATRTTSVDPITGQAATVAQFHNLDNQTLAITAYGVLSGGVAQVLNASGNLDRQRGTNSDVTTNIGVATGTQQLAWPVSAGPVTTGAITGSASVQTITLTNVSGTVNGVAWALQVGQSLVLDPNTSTQESFTITAINVGAKTVTGIITKAHASSALVTAFFYDQARSAIIPDGSTGQGIAAGGTYLYNSSLNSGNGGWESERSAKGELDGATGAGTNIAAEYEYNAGGPLLASGLASGFVFDRARNIQGKGLNVGAITASVAGNATIVLASAAATNTIQPGQKIRLRGGSIKETVITTAAWVPGSSATVSLQSPVVNSGQVFAEWDVYGTSGPGLNGFLADGIGIEEEALYDPQTDLFYLERASTADAMLPQNVVAESGVIWNGTTFDRMREVSADGVAATGLPAEVPMLWNGTTYDRLRGTGGAASVSLAVETTKTIGVVRAADGTGNLLTSTSGAIDVNIKSGANPNGQVAMANSAPVVVASDQSAIPVKPSAAATGGATNLHFFSVVGAPAAVAIKGTAGTLYGVQAINTGAAPVYLKLYNVVAASVVVGTTVPLMTLPVPTTATTGAGIAIPFPVGIAFGTAISYTFTNNAADNDATAVAVGTTLNVQFA